MAYVVARLGYFVAGVALAFVRVTAAHAQDSPEHYGVSVQLDSCVPVDHARFQHLLAIELGQSLEAVDSQAAAELAVVSLTCVDSQIRMQIDDATTRKSMTRSVELQRIDSSARTRLLALTVAEFLLASWLEVRLFREEQIEPAGPAPPARSQQRVATLVETKLTVRPRLQLGAAFEMLAFSSASKLVPALSVRLTLPVWSSLAVRLSAQAGYSSFERELERPARVLGVRATFGSLLAALLYTARLGGFELAAGGGGRFGFAFLSGIQSDLRDLEPQRSYAPWIGPAVLGSIAYRVGARAKLALSLELGWITTKTRAVAPNEVVAELKDLWGAASLGFDWEL